MRVGLVIVGVILLVIGAVLLFLPVVPQSSQTVNSGSSTPYTIFNVSGFSLTGSIPVSVDWSSTNGSVEVLAATCSNCATASLASIGSITFQNGSSGSFTLNQPDGGSTFVGVISNGSHSVTLNIKTALSTVGTILVPLGVLLLIVGAVLKSKKAKLAAAASPAPAAPGTPAPMPPAPPQT